MQNTAQTGEQFNNEKKTNLLAQKFVKNMVETASQAKLITILYDGAIQWLQMAKQEINRNAEAKPPNWSDFAHQCRMANKIMDHLQDSLNFDVAPDISDRLFALYDFIKETILKASISKNPTEFDVALRFLKELKDSWSAGLQKYELETSAT